jgi:hypothetical protein
MGFARMVWAVLVLRAGKRGAHPGGSGKHHSSAIWLADQIRVREAFAHAPIQMKTIEQSLADQLWELLGSCWRTPSYGG